MRPSYLQLFSELRRVGHRCDSVDRPMTTSSDPMALGILFRRSHLIHMLCIPWYFYVDHCNFYTFHLRILWWWICRLLCVFGVSTRLTLRYICHYFMRKLDDFYQHLSLWLCLHGQNKVFTLIIEDFYAQTWNVHTSETHAINFICRSKMNLVTYGVHNCHKKSNPLSTHLIKSTNQFS